MDKPVVGKQTLDVINNLHREKIEPYLVLLRHAVRNYGSPENDELMELTEEGRQTSSEFGKGLPSNSYLRFFSSPIRRCVQTSNLIEESFLTNGGKTETNRVIDDLYPFYVKDGPKVLAIAYEQAMAGNYAQFFREWFGGKIPVELMDNAEQSAQRLLHVLLEILEDSHGQGNICVSHDWHLFLLKEYYLGIKPEDIGNVEYLEGVVLYKSNGRYYISSHQGETRLLDIS